MTAGLRGRVVVVTGAGRCRGIGAAICKALAEEGADIFYLLNRPGDSGDSGC
jgi:3-oxoacyl-[acyl-carrier protein] reductase